MGHVGTIHQAEHDETDAEDVRVHGDGVADVVVVPAAVGGAVALELFLV